MANKTFSTAFANINSGRVLAKDINEWYKNRFFYTAVLTHNSYIFNEVLLWLYNNSASRAVDFDVAQHSITRRTAAKKGKIYLEGQTISFSLEEKAPPDDSASVRYAPISRNLNFSCKTSAGIRALHNLFDKLRLEKLNSPDNNYIWTSQTYGWEPQKFHGRDINSVILPPGMKEDIIADFDNFLDHEEFFANVGLPWHRGYLLSGPPGNGKTSLVSALANHYGMNLYILPLSTVRSDAMLGQKITSIEANSILLLEDIDIFTKTMSREQADDAPTLAGLLNALDGITTPHGMITVMTTNVVEGLDDALIRAGRIDKHIVLDPPVDEQIEELFLRAYGEQLGGTPRRFERMSDATEVIKRHTFDAEGARKDFCLNE